jgi:hypothetical protein
VGVGCVLQSLLAAPRLAAQTVHDSLSVVSAPPGHPPLVRIAATLPGDDDGETVLRLPDEWGGETALWRVVENLAVDGPGARLEAGADSARVIVRHAPGALLTIRCEVRQDRPGVPRAGNHRNLYRPLVLDRLLESVIVAGDFRVLTRGAEAAPLRVALGGTGLSDAFAFFATDNAQESTLNRILAHEHVHTWIPRRIGAMPDAGEARDYWLSEGFTDFLTFRLLLRDAIWTLDDYAAAVNEILATCARSPVRDAPNTAIVTGLWTGPEIGQLPYQRGFDPEATSSAGNVVTGLAPESPAHAAGLRNGMTILKLESGLPGDPTVSLVYLVRDGDVEHRIEYLPHGRRRFTTQRLVPPPAGDTEARDAVRRRLAGL